MTKEQRFQNYKKTIEQYVKDYEAGLIKVPTDRIRRENNIIKWWQDDGGELWNKLPDELKKRFQEVSPAGDFIWK